MPVDTGHAPQEPLRSSLAHLQAVGTAGAERCMEHAAKGAGTWPSRPWPGVSDLHRPQQLAAPRLIGRAERVQQLLGGSQLLRVLGVQQHLQRHLEGTRGTDLDLPLMLGSSICSAVCKTGRSLNLIQVPGGSKEPQSDPYQLSASVMSA